ncbi:uncharacterized protein NEMAJ01_1440 [Nematocida major]|uniref:uncharacterized protein n=1 Tax=Nematocida major TaxID=1912982 RepID=UPI002008ACDF|nr:uncharacterized protein NEMAJ01_1440 [Nematocida major]KAH9386544.1 hypothetical protein NEMAJ01_1440 [Nematocida major]
MVWYVGKTRKNMKYVHSERKLDVLGDMFYNLLYLRLFASEKSVEESLCELVQSLPINIFLHSENGAGLALEYCESADISLLEAKADGYSSKEKEFLHARIAMSMHIKTRLMQISRKAGALHAFICTEITGGDAENIKASRPGYTKIQAIEKSRGALLRIFKEAVKDAFYEVNSMEKLLDLIKDTPPRTALPRRVFQKDEVAESLLKCSGASREFPGTCTLSNSTHSLGSRLRNDKIVRIRNKNDFHNFYPSSPGYEKCAKCREMSPVYEENQWRLEFGELPLPENTALEFSFAPAIFLVSLFLIGGYLACASIKGLLA